MMENGSMMFGMGEELCCFLMVSDIMASGKMARCTGEEK
jgi:hypothetical protein